MVKDLQAEISTREEAGVVVVVAVMIIGIASISGCCLLVVIRVSSWRVESRSDDDNE